MEAFLLTLDMRSPYLCDVKPKVGITKSTLAGSSWDTGHVSAVQPAGSQS